MSAALCPDCRAAAVASVRAAVCVLADASASTSERETAADVATEFVELLRLPPGEVDAGW